VTFRAVFLEDRVRTQRGVSRRGFGRDRGERYQGEEATQGKVQSGWFHASLEIRRLPKEFWMRQKTFGVAAIVRVSDASSKPGALSNLVPTDDRE
jgi:hypothetical protein